MPFPCAASKGLRAIFRNHMRKHVFAAAIAAALACPLLAQAEGFYAGGGIGRSERKLTIDDEGSQKKHETGYKAYAGYQVTPHFGVEAGYVDFGKIRDTEGGTSASLNTSAVYAAATGTLPLNAQFSLFAKAGVTRNHTVPKSPPGEVNATGTRNNTAALLGIGGAYRINAQLSAVVEYENFGKTLSVKDANMKADLLSIGLRYKF